MIVGFLEEFLVIGRRARPDRGVIGQAGAILLVQALQRRPGTGLDGQDPLQGVARERVITHRALDGRQHVFAPVEAEKTQHLAGLALAIAMSRSKPSRKRSAGSPNSRNRSRSTSSCSFESRVGRCAASVRRSPLDRRGTRG